MYNELYDAETFPLRKAPMPQPDQIAKIILEFKKNAAINAGRIILDPEQAEAFIEFMEVLQRQENIYKKIMAEFRKLGK